jgi:hypothetical protein
MGFEFPSTIITIDFPAGHELHGLEVRTKSVPFGTFLELSSLAGSAGEAGDGALKAMARLVDDFAASAFLGWNSDVPATAAGLRSLDTRHVLDVIGAWLRAAGGEVPAPLGQPSSAGGLSVVELPPMELPSVSPAS